MLKRFMPSEKAFFQLFEEAAAQVEQASAQFYAMAGNLQQAEHYAQNIKQIEKQGDKIARSTFELLHKSFVSPFDREHIHAITSKLDDILDSINRAAQHISLYQLKQLPKEIHELARLTEFAATELTKAIDHLEKLKHTDEILAHCDAVNKAKSEAYQMALKGIAHLFENESDFKQLLKLKDIYEYGKFIIEQCSDLSNILKGIVLEYA